MAANAVQHTLMSDLAAVVARLRAITVELRTTGRAVGSGVIWRADGLVVTSAHVVASARSARESVQWGAWGAPGAPEGLSAVSRGAPAAPGSPERRGAWGAPGAPHVLTVALADKRRLPATFVEWDHQLDLALLRIEATELPAALVGDSSRLRPGELVMAVGHPFGLAGAVATGVVHAVSGRGCRTGPGWIQADLRLAPGNSGGPMADAGGRVIGVNAMIAGGLALAVPSHIVQAFVMRSAGP